MDGIDEQLRRLIQGHHVPLLEQDDVPLHIESYTPVVKDTVFYIVSAVVMNEAREVLMVQEAKEECHGRWYLPAGRVEKGETLLDAVKREVAEEAGVEFIPQTLITVEVATGYWYRFTFTGSVTGKLKCTPDKESLAAEWCSYEEVMKWNGSIKLRAPDIRPLIKTCKQFHDRQGNGCHADVMPHLQAYSHLHIRVVVIHQLPDSDGYKVIIGKQPEPHFPSGTISDEDFSLQVPLFRVLTKIFGKVAGAPNILGLLSVDHRGQNHGAQERAENNQTPTVRTKQSEDGLCLTVALSIESANPDLTPADTAEYEWRPYTSGEIHALLKQKLQPEQLVSVLLVR